MSITILDNRDKTELQEYVDTIVADSKSDWNESNPESPSYIKNRTHYEERTVIELMPETTLDMNENGSGEFYSNTPLAYDLDLNTTYTITYNGTEYQCKPVDLTALMGLPVYGFGNFGAVMPDMFPATEEPFVIVITPPDTAAAIGMPPIAVTPIEWTETVVLKIRGETVVVKKLDEKYLDKPNWAALDGESGYIENRTHYADYINSFIYDAEKEYNTVLPLTENWTVKKISNYYLTDTQLENAQYYVAENAAAEKKQYTETIAAADNGDSCIVFNNDLVIVSIPNNGLYIDSDYGYVEIVFNAEIIKQLDTKYFDTDSIIEKIDANSMANKMKNVFYTKEQVEEIAGINNKYEFIYEETLEEKETTIGSNLLNRQGYYAKIYIPVSDEYNKAIQLNIYNEAGSVKRHIFISDGLSTTKENYIIVKCVNNKGMIEASLLRKNTNDNHGTYEILYPPYDEFCNSIVSNIAGITLQATNAYLPIGTTIKIWGCN